MHWLLGVRVSELVLAQLACEGAGALAVWCSPGDAAFAKTVNCRYNAGLAEQDVDGFDSQPLSCRVKLKDFFLQGC